VSWAICCRSLSMARITGIVASGHTRRRKSCTSTRWGRRQW
jgi:hypothetical protein